MISSEHQYIITKTKLKEFEASLAELRLRNATMMDYNDQMGHKLHLDAISGQINSFEQEIAEYERSKNKTTQRSDVDPL
jgi:hypothetical protein